MSIQQTILDHLAGTLRAAGLFREVCDGPGRSDAVPRAELRPGPCETTPADDGATAWHRVACEVTIHAAAATAGAAWRRLVELLDLARAALLADPFRGGAASHLPCGPATGIGPAVVDAERPPLASARFVVTCHAESTGGAP